MMREIKNGEPVFHKHSCSEEREGQVMTTEELHDFAVEVLMYEYAETGAKVTRYDKKNGNEADFCYVNSGKTRRFSGDYAENAVNILVVCRNKFTKDISDIDTSWLVEEYHRTGAFPRVTIAMGWCRSDNSKKGQPAICGGNFFFKYYSISVLPDEKNEKLEKKLSPVGLAVKYAESWKQLDASIVAPYLDKDFHYGSNWVFDELPCRKEYMDYFEGKLAAIRRTGALPKIAIVRNHQNEKVAVLIVQDDDISSLELETKDGRITSAFMNEYDETYKVFDPEDELYMTHGNHLDSIMPAEELMTERLRDIVHEAKPWRYVNTQVTTDDMYEKKTGVSSLMYGESDIRMLTTIAVSKKTHQNLFMSIYPFGKGVPVEVHIDKVIEWDNQIEATVLCSVDEFAFAFFPVDYYCNKNLYKVGETISVDLAALGINVQEAERGFQFEGQQAIDWLAKTGRDPDYDENGNVIPVKFNTENMIAFLNSNSKCPDEAEFQSPADEIEATSFLDIDFFKTNIIIYRLNKDEGEVPITIPLYFRKDFFPEVKKADPICGWLWITGSVTGEHEENYERKQTLGDIAADFEEFMDGCNFESFDNLMFVLRELPLIKIRDGYEFDAFENGDVYGWHMQPYCCKAGADVHYVPEEHGDYTDSLRIDGRIDYESASKVPAALTYMEVPFTEEGIMQAWLLDNLTDFMPKGWHANYGAKTFIFDESRVDELFPNTDNGSTLTTSLNYDRMKVKDKVMALDRASLLPSVTIDGDTAVMEYAYWNNWSGMNKVRVPVTKVGNTVVFGEPEKEILVEYHCGIRF